MSRIPMAHPYASSKAFSRLDSEVWKSLPRVPVQRLTVCAENVHHSCLPSDQLRSPAETAFTEICQGCLLVQLDIKPILPCLSVIIRDSLFSSMQQPHFSSQLYIGNILSFFLGCYISSIREPRQTNSSFSIWAPVLSSRHCNPQTRFW